MLVDRFTGEFDGRLYEFSHIAPFQLWLNHARLNFSHLEQIIDHSMQAAYCKFHLSQCSLTFFIAIGLSRYGINAGLDGG